MQILIQCMWVLTLRGYFTATQAMERTGENLNGTSFRVGTGTFLSLPKQNIAAAEKTQLVFLIYRSNMLLLKALHRQLNKDTSIVYISPKTG